MVKKIDLFKYLSVGLTPRETPKFGTHTYAIVDNIFGKYL